MTAVNDIKPVAEGSAFLEVLTSARVALSLLTANWSADEIEALKAGDEEAKIELEDALTQYALSAPDSIDVQRFELRISEPTP